MRAVDFALELKGTVEKLKSDGVNEIKSENLIQYLAKASKDLASEESMDAELHKANLQKWIEDVKCAHAHSIEMFKSVITAGQNALRTSFLMNGGASVATLAFIGHIATSDAPSRVQLFVPSLTMFGFGVLIAALASGGTYLSQWFYASERSWAVRIGFWLNIGTIILGIAAYVVFGFGVMNAANVFLAFK